MKAFALFFMFLFSFQLSKAEGIIRVKPLVKLKGEKNITLGQMSEFQNISKKTQKILSQVVLGNAPKSGEKRVFSSTAIAMTFRKHLNGDLAKKHKIIIPNEVLVKLDDHQWNENNLKEELTKIWQTMCSDCDFRIQYVSLPIVSNDGLVEDWSLDIGKDLPKGSFNVPVYIKIQKQPMKQFWLSGHVKVYKKVPVVTKAMSMGEFFTEEHLAMEDRDITFAYDSTPSKKDVIGKRASQSLRSGSIVWQNLVLREKAVQRGEIVKLTTGNETFEVSTTGKAENDAYVGDTVQVRNLKSNKILSGRAVAKGEVRME